MSSAAVLQISSVGIQDAWLSSNPQISFFRKEIKRHTRFACSPRKFLPSGGSPGFGSEVNITVLKDPDLVSRSYLRVTLPEITPSTGQRVAWCRDIGLALIDTISVELGNTTVDRQTGRWMKVASSLNVPESKQKAYLQLIGNVDDLTRLDDSTKPSRELFIPLSFWFCEDTGLAFPLIAAQYHNFTIRVKFNELSKLINTNDTGILSSIGKPDLSLHVEGVYLSSIERIMFAKYPYESVISVTNNINNLSNSNANPSVNHKLDGNHPVKGLFWTTTLDQYTNGSKFFDYTAGEWTNDFLLKVAEKLVRYSVFAAPTGATVPAGWTELTAKALATDPANEVQVGNIRYVNNSSAAGNSLWYNYNILTKSGFNLLDEINAVVEVNDNSISVYDVETTLTVQDLSFDVSTYTDARITSTELTTATATLYQLVDDVTVYDTLNFGAFIDRSGELIETASIRIQSNDRVEENPIDYFSRVQPFQHCKRAPNNGVNMYSFALKPFDSQPSGSINMSRFDSLMLILKFKTLAVNGHGNVDYTKSNTYATLVNCNVLRVVAGLAGVIFAS